MGLLLLCATVTSLVLAASAGCPSKTQLGGRCARLYEHNNCVGSYRDVRKETQVSSLVGAGFNDRASSLVVASGCKFTMYQHGRFSGSRRDMLGDAYPGLGYVSRGGWFTTASSWNDVISSYKCTCTSSGRGGGKFGIAKGKGPRGKGKGQRSTTMSTEA